MPDCHAHTVPGFRSGQQLRAVDALRRGTDQINFTLNFSKGASQIVAQYYQFLRLGRAGYTKIMQNCHAVAMYLQKAIEDSGYFTIISARDPVPMLPLATFSLKPEFRLNGCAASSLLFQITSHL